MNNVKDLLKLQPSFQQFFRWRRIRKPIWLGTAKSKLFRIPTRPVIPDEERQELFRLHTNYKTAVRSINAFLAVEYEKSQEKVDINTVKKEAALDYERCKAVNDAWNKSIAEEREVRLTKERDAKIDDVLSRVEAKKRRDEEHTKHMTAIIEQEKVYLENLITPENIDQVIATVLENTTTYDYAIDTSGNKITTLESDLNQLNSAKSVEK